MKNIRIIIILMVVTLSACTDLDVPPKSDATGELIFNDPATYEAFIAKIYAGFSLTGQQGPAGAGDIRGIDEGASNYVRQYWQLQELPTDEAVIGWADGNLPTLNTQTWTDENEFITAMYYRIFFNVSLANEFLREASEEKLSERGFTEAVKANIATYRAEARYVRALSYWHGLDLFGNIPFYTEANAIGSDAPDQATPQEVFTFIENELIDIESELADFNSTPYGRASKEALWALQAKLYLNATVYTGADRSADCLASCEKIINSGAFSLADNYQLNFGADNHTSNEIIFAALFDGDHIRTWGGTTYLVNASIGGSMDPTAYGVAGGWSGLRTTSNLVNLFPDETGGLDGRAIFYTDGQTKEITSITDFTNGYAVPKFTNVTSGGQSGSDETHPDTDFAFFRLADVYLMYAEAVLRGGGGNTATAVGYINMLRERAYGTTAGNISSADLTLDFILDERARELYWEGHRRTDLIRFNEFTENGVWPWKGGTQAGETTASYLNLYPIPSADLIANPKLEQNDQY